MPERTLGKPRVWNDEVRGVHYAIVEEHDVEIERARAPSGAADPARVGLGAEPAALDQAAFRKLLSEEERVLTTLITSQKIVVD